MVQKEENDISTQLIDNQGLSGNNRSTFFIEHLSDFIPFDPINKFYQKHDYETFWAKSMVR